MKCLAIGLSVATLLYTAHSLFTIYILPTSETFLSVQTGYASVVVNSLYNYAVRQP